MESIEELKKKIAEYEKRMGIGSFDPVRDGYMVLVDNLRQQNEYLKGFKIAEKIGNAVKDDPVYARSMELVEKLPKTISSISSLRQDLKMDGEDENEQHRVIPISPQSIAKSKIDQCIIQ